MPETAALLSAWRARADAALTAALQRLQATAPTCLLAAMHHAVLLGGKRLRPLLVYASAHVAGRDADTLPGLDAPATAVELIHAYSLVHDDLPAMDNDALRRGRPTVHVAFGQAQAIIAGDALQALAFQVLADAEFPDAIRVELVAELARAAGASGMCGGQALDMMASSADTTLATLERLHALKTGALLRTAVQMGATAAGSGNELRSQLDTYATALGMAFQIRDDLLDVESNSTALGKTAGKDTAQHKATFPALLGIPASRQRLVELADTMHEALSALPPQRRAPLDALARHVVERDH